MLFCWPDTHNRLWICFWVLFHFLRDAHFML
jgi:hypothetical protein